MPYPEGIPGVRPLGGAARESKTDWFYIKSRYNEGMMLLHCRQLERYLAPLEDGRDYAVLGMRPTGPKSIRLLLAISGPVGIRSLGFGVLDLEEQDTVVTVKHPGISITVSSWDDVQDLSLFSTESRRQSWYIWSKDDAEYLYFELGWDGSLRTVPKKVRSLP